MYFNIDDLIIMFFVFIFCIFKGKLFFIIKFSIDGIKYVCVVFFFVIILYVVLIVLVIEDVCNVLVIVIWVFLLLIF